MERKSSQVISEEFTCVEKRINEIFANKINAQTKGYFGMNQIHQTSRG